MKFLGPLALLVAAATAQSDFALSAFLPPCGQMCVRIAIEGENRAGTGGTGGAVDCELNDASCLCVDENVDAVALASVSCVTSGCGPEIGATAARFALNQFCTLSGF